MLGYLCLSKVGLSKLFYKKNSLKYTESHPRVIPKIEIEMIHGLPGTNFYKIIKVMKKIKKVFKSSFEYLRIFLIIS